MCTWRSDLAKIEVSDDGNRFTEFTKDGFETEFTIALKKPCERYEFDMKNKNMDGHWIGLFSKDGSGTKIEFTEEVKVSNPIMKLFVKAYLKKALGEQNEHNTNPVNSDLSGCCINCNARVAGSNPVRIQNKI